MRSHQEEGFIGLRSGFFGPRILFSGLGFKGLKWGNIEAEKANYQQNSSLEFLNIRIV